MTSVFTNDDSNYILIWEPYILIWEPLGSYTYFINSVYFLLTLEPNSPRIQTMTCLDHSALEVTYQLYMSHSPHVIKPSYTLLVIALKPCNFGTVSILIAHAHAYAYAHTHTYKRCAQEGVELC